MESGDKLGGFPLAPDGRLFIEEKAESKRPDFKHKPVCDANWTYA